MPRREAGIQGQRSWSCLLDASFHRHDGLAVFPCNVLRKKFHTFWTPMPHYSEKTPLSRVDSRRDRRRGQGWGGHPLSTGTGFSRGRQERNSLLLTGWVIKSTILRQKQALR